MKAETRQDFSKCRKKNLEINQVSSAAARLKKKLVADGEQEKKIFYYLCRHCKAYHLTTKQTTGSNGFLKDAFKAEPSPQRSYLHT